MQQARTAPDPETSNFLTDVVSVKRWVVYVWEKGREREGER